MNRRVKIGILGCANIAERYSIIAFQSLPNAEVVGIASRDANKAREWASKFGIPKFYDYESMIMDKEVDAVYVPLPIGLHKEWVIKSALVGKHILCEKSLSPSLKDTKEIIASCKQNDVVLYENFTCDYNLQHNKVVESIESGHIGRPYLFQSLYGFPIIGENNFRYNKDLGGSALSESGAYQVYTARRLFGEPVSVGALLNFDQKTGVDMNGSVTMDFGNNVVAQFAFNLNAVYQNSYTVWGENGLLRVSRAYAIPPSMKPVVELTKNENRQEAITTFDIPANNHFEKIFGEFCNLVLDKENQKENVEKKYSDLLNQAKVLEAIRESSNSSGKILLSEIN